MKDNYVILSEDKIVEDILLGKIINNYRVLDNKKVFNHNISKQDISLLLYYYDVSETNLSFVLYLYNKCYNNEDNIILKDIFNNTTSICGSKSLVEVLKGGNIEVSITDSDQKVLHGRSDYLDKDNNVYEFKSSSSSSEEYKSILQTWLYYVMFGNEDSFAYLLDLSKGYLYELSSNESIHRWRYIIRSYFILRHHVDLVTSRRNYYLIYGTEDQKNHLNNLDIKDNLFTVDTEFYNKDIFEIALVNINDPYRTIVDLIRPMSLEGMIFALDWLPDTVTEMYKSSIDKLKMKFNISTSKSKDSPKLGYYIAGMDVDWCLRKDVTKINLSDSARKAAETKGCFLAGSFGPKLGELYTLLAPYPLEYQKHLQAHTALADSLMLYELMILGHLSI